jgi:hypothetical protein
MTDSEYGSTQNINDWIEGLVDAGAETLCEIRCDWDREKALIQAENRQQRVDLDALLAPLKERISRLEGEVSILTTMLGSDSGRAKAKQLRQQRDSGHLLEPPRAQ